MHDQKLRQPWIDKREKEYESFNDSTFTSVIATEKTNFSVELAKSQWMSNVQVNKILWRNEQPRYCINTILINDEKMYPAREDFEYSII